MGEKEEEVEEEYETDDELEEEVNDESSFISNLTDEKMKLFEGDKAQIKLFEVEVKEDNSEIKEGVKEVLTKVENIAPDQLLDKSIRQFDDLEKKLITPQDQLDDLKSWKDAELKIIQDNSLTDEQKHDYLIEDLKKLVKKEKKRVTDTTERVCQFHIIHYNSN